MKIKILIYGAGVIGCQLAHMLIRANNDVTLLARGRWRQTIEERGLVIRHSVQLHTTKDRVATISKLEPEDIYDIIFVATQYGQLGEVLPEIAQNRSRHIVLVGNNMNAGDTAGALANSDGEKEVAFGFQGSAGRRENGKVFSMHVTTGMTIGGLDAPLSECFRNRIKDAFADVPYHLTWEEHMDAWLKCHMAFILPVAYICYATDFQLSKSTGRQRGMAIDAAIEGYAMLKQLGHPIRPAGSDAYLEDSRRKVQALLLIMAKTPLGRLAASDHCRNARLEMAALDAAFEALRSRAGMPMPNWDALRGEGIPT